MTEAIIIFIFLVLFFIIQFRDQKELQFKVKQNKTKKIIAVLVALGLVITFYQNPLSERIIMFSFALMIVSVSFFQEGITKDGLVLYGLLVSPYKNYNKVELEETKQQDVTRVIFHKTKGSKIVTFSFDEELVIIQQYLHQVLPNDFEIIHVYPKGKKIKKTI